jgi:hypothetical protein
MAAMHAGLTGVGVRPQRIRMEAFGPSSLPTATAPRERTTPEHSGDAVRVEFRRSGGEALWRPAEESLLDLAERRGLTPAYSCRAGVCGTCAVRLWSGAMDYAEPPLASVAAEEVLICCARPRTDAPGAPTAGPASIAIDL